jgi:hypothetical protein
MKEGNNQKWTGEAAIGAISSKATIEGPIIKNRASVIVLIAVFIGTYL